MTVDVESSTSSIPDFELELPPGWRRHPVDDHSLQTLLGETRRRCMEQQRPELFAHLKSLLEESFDQMRKAHVFAYFSPTDPGEQTLALPSSINASIRAGEPGQSLDSLVRMMIRHHGATPLLGDRGTIRLERERELVSEQGTAINHSVIYLTPVPGTGRKKALQLVAAFPRPADVSADAPEIDAVRALFDACVSTLRWVGVEVRRTPRP